MTTHLEPAEKGDVSDNGPETQGEDRRTSNSERAANQRRESNAVATAVHPHRCDGARSDEGADLRTISAVVR